MSHSAEFAESSLSTLLWQATFHCCQQLGQASLLLAGGTVARLRAAALRVVFGGEVGPLSEVEVEHRLLDQAVTLHGLCHVLCLYVLLRRLGACPLRIVHVRPVLEILAITQSTDDLALLVLLSLERGGGLQVLDRVSRRPERVALGPAMG